MTRAALAVLAVAAACDAPARAQPAPAAEPPVPVAVPAGWRPIPAASDAGQAAASQGNPERPALVRTWGETGLGCFVTVVEVHGIRAEPLAQVAAELEKTLGALAVVSGWTFIDGPAAELTAQVTRGAMRGAVRGRLFADPTGLPHAAAAACFYNEREPARCQAACTEILASLEAPRVTP